MKKAFTLSEALITLAIIGVLAAILIPVISNVRPDKDRIHYKKALYSLQSAVSNAMDSTEYSMAANSAAYWSDSNIGDEDFCKAIADALNTTGKVNCSGPFPKCANPPAGISPLPTNKSCYWDPNFITTDGIRYWNLEGKFETVNNKVVPRTIYVDRNINTNELVAIERNRGRLGNAAYGMKIQVRYDGKVGTGLDGDDTNFTYENELTEQSLQVTAGKNTN